MQDDDAGWRKRLMLGWYKIFNTEKRHGESADIVWQKWRVIGFFCESFQSALSVSLSLNDNSDEGSGMKMVRFSPFHDRQIIAGYRGEEEVEIWWAISRYQAGLGSSYWSSDQCRASPGSPCTGWCPSGTIWKKHKHRLNVCRIYLLNAS